MTKAITVEVTVNSPIEKVWNFWTEPSHIQKWNNASDDWHTPHATNNLKVGGRFLARMEAKDGSAGFDFEGIYTAIKRHSVIEYKMSDGRKVKIEFISGVGKTKVIETFDPEHENSIDMQKAGWQSILNNFKKYTESN